jgi:hypothetical protein
VPHVAAIPHLDTFGGSWVPGVRAGAPSGAIVVGVDERSAALWAGGTWRALGPGGVTVFADGTERRAASGEPVDGLPQPAVGPV